MAILFTNKFPAAGARRNSASSQFVGAHTRDGNRVPARSVPFRPSFTASSSSPFRPLTSVENVEKVPWPRKDCWSLQRGNSDKRQSARRKLHPRSRPRWTSNPISSLFTPDYTLTTCPSLSLSFYELSSDAKHGKHAKHASWSRPFRSTRKWFSSSGKGYFEGIRNERTLTGRECTYARNASKALFSKALSLRNVTFAKRIYIMIFSTCRVRQAAYIWRVLTDSTSSSM